LETDGPAAPEVIETFKAKEKEKKKEVNVTIYRRESVGGHRTQDLYLYLVLYVE